MSIRLSSPSAPPAAASRHPRRARSSRVRDQRVRTNIPVASGCLGYSAGVAGTGRKTPPLQTDSLVRVDAHMATPELTADPVLPPHRALRRRRLVHHVAVKDSTAPPGPGEASDRPIAPPERASHTYRHQTPPPHALTVLHTIQLWILLNGGPDLTANRVTAPATEPGGTLMSPGEYGPPLDVSAPVGGATSNQSLTSASVNRHWPGSRPPNRLQQRHSARRSHARFGESASTPALSAGSCER